MNIACHKIIIVFIVCLFIAACSQEKPKIPVDKVNVQLAWKHQSQFAGFYAADINGFYEEENIKVKLHPKADPTFNVIDSVVSGEADFGVNYGVGLIEARSNMLPVTAIASIYQRYPLTFLSLKDNNITKPQDLTGRRLSSLSPGGATIVFDLLLQKYNLDKSKMVFVHSGYDLDLLFSGELDVWSAYATNEVLIAQEKGYEINQIKPGDFGIKMMGDTLFTSEMLISTNPDLVTRFTRATVRGWNWAITHPVAAGQLALQYDHTLQREHQIAMMQASIPYIQTSPTPIGILDPMLWQEVHNVLLLQGFINKPLNMSSVYTNDFVPQITQGKESNENE